MENKYITSIKPTNTQHSYEKTKGLNFMWQHCRTVVVSVNLKFLEVKLFEITKRYLVMDVVFPVEVIEKILSYLDGETLLACQEVSPQFAFAAEYMTAKNIWKECCLGELSKSSLFQITFKLYPHNEGLDHAKNWKLIYECWSMLKDVITIKNWDVTVLKVSDKFTEVCDISAHGDLILVLLKYNKDFSFYKKIITINNMNNVVAKSCRFYSDSLYVTAIENSYNRDSVLLYCESCKLIGIPTNAKQTKKYYPKIKCDTNMLSVEHSNGDLLYFNNTLGILNRSNCIGIGKRSCLEQQTIFVNVSLELSHLFISCDDVHREFDTVHSLHARVTCSRTYSSLLLLGTATGMLYGYFFRNKFDILELELFNYKWCFNISTEPLLGIDVTVVENQFGIVCCNKNSVYRLKVDR